MPGLSTVFTEGPLVIDDLPLPVVNFLNVIGVPWPYIDEDIVLRFALLTREFGQAVSTTHEDGTRAVHTLAEAHQGTSTEAMRTGWVTMSNKHVNEIVTGCDALAVALDAQRVTSWRRRRRQSRSSSGWLPRLSSTRPPR